MKNLKQMYVYTTGTYNGKFIDLFVLSEML